MISRPAIAILGTKKKWMSVLRNMGQMFFLISPDASISEYDECYKICDNQYHFLNAYLNVSRTVVKKSLTSPKVETSRALQRLAVISMSAFLLNRYQQLPADFAFAEFKRTRMINKLLETILAPQGKSKMNILTALGYDIALRYWIKEKTGKLQLREKKARVNKDVEQLRAQLNQVGNTLKNVESRVDNMQKNLQDVKNAIEKLQHLQQWFSMHKVLLDDILYLYPGKSNIAEYENHDERDTDTDNNGHVHQNVENVGVALENFESKGEEIKMVESEESQKKYQVQFSESDGDEEEESDNSSEK